MQKLTIALLIVGYANTTVAVPLELLRYLRMSDEDTIIGIARTVCENFIDGNIPTSRRTLLKEFENVFLLDQMGQQGLIRASNDRENCLPTPSTFALLGDQDDLYQSARKAFELVAVGLYNLYKDQQTKVDHEVLEFGADINRRYDKTATRKSIALGLYLASDFGLLQPTRMSEDRINIERFQVAERAIEMRDPKPIWEKRVNSAREPLQTYDTPSDLFQTNTRIEIAETIIEDQFDGCGFWTLIHPAITEEARSRFEAGHYADAVESALKIVAQEVRNRTGLTLDGADLMHKAFSPKKPELRFDDPIPSTRDSLQQGYMEIFAGSMTGIRNPKAHGIVQLDSVRCIHFLFLASLLRFKVDETVDAEVEKQ